MNPYDIKSVRIKGKKYKVLWVSDAEIRDLSNSHDPEETVGGYHSVQDLKIWLNKEQPLVQARDAFLHEIHHVVAPELSERTIERLTENVMAIYLDNPAVAQFIATYQEEEDASQES